MDINQLRNTNKLDIFWLNPESKKTLVIRYVEPWTWNDFILFTENNIEWLKQIHYEFALLHDFSLFSSSETLVGSIYDNLMKKLPPIPPTLRFAVVIDPNKKIMAEIGFEIIEKALYRKKKTYFVTSMDAAKKLLSSQGFF